MMDQEKTLDGIQKFLENCPTNVVVDESFAMHWSKAGFGFGTATFYFNEDTNSFHCDNEYMSKDFIKEMFAIFVDDCVFDNEKE